MLKIVGLVEWKVMLLPSLTSNNDSEEEWDFGGSCAISEQEGKCLNFNIIAEINYEEDWD